MPRVGRRFILRYTIRALIQFTNMTREPGDWKHNILRLLMIQVYHNLELSWNYYITVFHPNLVLVLVFLISHFSLDSNSLSSLLRWNMEKKIFKEESCDCYRITFLTSACYHCATVTLPCMTSKARCVEGRRNKRMLEDERANEKPENWKSGPDLDVKQYNKWWNSFIMPHDFQNW